MAQHINKEHRLKNKTRNKKIKKNRDYLYLFGYMKEREIVSYDVPQRIYEGVKNDRIPTDKIRLYAGKKKKYNADINIYGNLYKINVLFSDIGKVVVRRTGWMKYDYYTIFRPFVSLDLLVFENFNMRLTYIFKSVNTIVKKSIRDFKIHPHRYSNKIFSLDSMNQTKFDSIAAEIFIS